jgi:polyisoprenoid-binding protein YceI
VIPEGSTLSAEARSSLHPIRVQTDGIEGFIELTMNRDAIDLTVKPRARIELDAELIKTGNSLYDRELENRLQVNRYPRVRGEVSEVSHLGGNRYHVTGTLALHGITHQVEGEVTLTAAPDAAELQVEGEQSIDMRDFGLEPPKLLMLRVYPEVKLRGRVIARREGKGS